MKQLQLVKQKSARKPKKEALRARSEYKISPRKRRLRPSPRAVRPCKTSTSLQPLTITTWTHPLWLIGLLFFPCCTQITIYYLWTSPYLATALAVQGWDAGSTRCLSHPGLDLCVAWERKSQLKYKNPLSTAKCFKNKRNPKSCVGVCVCKMV